MALSFLGLIVLVLIAFVVIAVVMLASKRGAHRLPPCPRCNRGVPLGSVVCPHCGSKLP